MIEIHITNFNVTPKFSYCSKNKKFPTSPLVEVFSITLIFINLFYSYNYQFLGS